MHLPPDCVWWVKGEASALKWNERKFLLQVTTVADLCWQELLYRYPSLDKLLPACTVEMNRESGSECAEDDQHCNH